MIGTNVMTAKEAREKMVAKAIEGVLDSIKESINFGEMSAECDISLDGSLQGEVINQLGAAGYLLAVIDKNDSGMSLSVSWKEIV